MADYSAKIQLIVEGLQALNKVEQKLKDLNKIVQNDLRVDVKANTGIKKIGEDLDAMAAKGRAAAKSLQDSFKNVGNIAKGAGIAGAIVAVNQFGVALEAAANKAGLFSPALTAVGSAIKGAVPGVDALVNAFIALPPALQATAPAIAAVTAGLLAFNQPIRTAITDTKTLVDALNPVKTAIKSAFSTTLLMAFSEQLDMNINAVNNYRSALLSLTDTVSALSRRKSNLQTVLNNNNASTETAAKIAAKLVDVTKRLNAEQQAQNDLLRQAAGLRTESEERRATNTYNVTQRRKSFKAQQSQDELTLQQALLRLEERSAEIANTKLQVQGEISRITARSVNAARIQALQPSAPLMLPAFKERGLQLLDNSVKLNESNLRIEQALNGERARGVRFLEKQTAEEARQVQLGILGTKTNKLPGTSAISGGPFPVEGPIPLSAFGRQTKGVSGIGAGALGKRLPGAISGGIIGGAFPLLFGQSGAAAAGGAIGGVAGGLLGPGGSFAGSLLGTLIGEKAGQGNKIKELAADIGFSAEQAKLLGTAFKQAGADFDKFQESLSRIQGLSLSIEDQGRAIQLASALTENYGGKIDKVTNAFANALSTGKVTQGTLNQLTSQGIPIQEALAKKYDVSRSAILQMAKDGKISTQDLIDTLVKLGNEGTTSATKQQKAFNDAYASIQTALENLGATISSIFGSSAEKVVSGFNTALLGTLKYIREVIEGLDALAQVAGPVLKVIADKYIEIETNALKAIGAMPGLGNAIVQMATTALGPLQGVVLLIEKIRGARGLKKEKQGPYVPDRLKEAPLTSFNAPSQFVSGSKDTAADKAAKAAEREAARVANIVRDRAVATEELKLQMQYSQGIFTAEVAKDNVLKIQLQSAQKYGQISLEYNKLINDEIAKGNSTAAKEAITQEYLVRLQQAQLEEGIALKTEELKRAENYQNMLLDLQYELDLRSATTEQAREQLRIAYEMEKLRQGKEFTDPQLAEIRRRKEQVAAPKTAAETIGDRIGTLQDELTKLTSVGQMAITIADGIGNAFGQAFQGLISGSLTAKEALAGFFKSVGDMFISMATEIIAKQMVMIVLQTILKALGAVGGASGGSNNYSGAFGANGPTFNPGAFSMPRLAANGATFANGISAFASGGVVGSPTLFKFADGGTTKNGLMGEAGPEAIMPLRRDGSGRLGVSASGLRDAMAGGGGSGGGTVLNMSFETTSIGGVEYVSRDQLEAAMAQTRRDATRDGAKRGMTMTIDRLQQSPQTRSRVGLR